MSSSQASCHFGDKERASKNECFHGVATVSLLDELVYSLGLAFFVVPLFSCSLVAALRLVLAPSRFQSSFRCSTVDSNSDRSIVVVVV